MAKSEHIPDDLTTLARTAAEARARGDKYFFNGIPCPHGHIDARRAANGDCRTCTAIRSVAYAKRKWAEGKAQRAATKEAKRLADEQARQNRIDEIGIDAVLAEEEAERQAKAEAKRLRKNERAREAYQAELAEGTEQTRKKYAAKSRDRYAANPEPERARINKRHAEGKSGYRMIRLRTPDWLTDAELAEMQDMYDRRDKAKREEVDHIVPIDSHPTLAGTHTPWNVRILQRGPNNRRAQGKADEFTCTDEEAIAYVAGGYAVWKKDIAPDGSIDWNLYPRPSNR